MYSYFDRYKNYQFQKDLGLFGKNPGFDYLDEKEAQEILDKANLNYQNNRR